MIYEDLFFNVFVSSEVKNYIFVVLNFFVITTILNSSGYMFPWKSLPGCFHLNFACQLGFSRQNFLSEESSL
jgi:hypothetical protein